MLVLGVTAKDKGGQLESLVHAELEGQGYVRVQSNVVGSGGNELDVVGEREINLGGSKTRVFPLLCEAKAYADPVNMPTWQKFLGKLYLARMDKPTSMGLLVALNGVNGNVRGSFDSVQMKDDSIDVIDGLHLLERARNSKQIAPQELLLTTITEQFRRQASRIEVAYYGGGFFWLVWWNDLEYSIVGSHGARLSVEEVEGLRPALEASVSGNLLATDEAQAQAEARHGIKAGYINQLIQGEVLAVDNCINAEDREVIEQLETEPYCYVENGQLVLRSASELDADAIARLFISLFENVVSIRHLVFMVDSHHEAYVRRLIDTLAERQAGFTVQGDELNQLHQLAPYFPSVWVLLSKPIAMITNHREEGIEETNEGVLASDRNAFWDEIIKASRDNFTNVFLRGFLYDHVGLAEFEEVTEVVVKSKQGVIGNMTSETRTAVRQLSEEFFSESGTRHAVIRMVQSIEEPWEQRHPDPIPVEESFPKNATSAETKENINSL